MPYELKSYDGVSTLINLEDGVLDSSSSSLNLVGRNYSNFGTAQNENFLWLLENFSGGSAPTSPIKGQLWYDTENRYLRVYTGGDWLKNTISEFSGNKPTTGRPGYLWFDSAHRQFYVHDGTDYMLVGPERTIGFGTTRLISTSTYDLYNNAHAVIQLTVNDETLAIISPDDFDVNSTSNQIDGFPHVYRGITLKNHSTGNVEIHGRSVFSNLATTATNIGGGTAGALSYQTLPGYTGFVSIGTATSVLVSSGATPHWSAPNEILLGNITTSTNLTGGTAGAIPYQSAPGKTSFLAMEQSGFVLVSGSSSPRWKAQTEFGAGTAMTATRADSLLSSVGTGNYIYADTSSNISTVVERDGNGNIYANNVNAALFIGTATSAQYADLAEKYLADDDYEIGTVVSVGGEKEVTASGWGDLAIGVVSQNPAYMMNSELLGGTYIALKGRVPVKVLGAIRKGQRLIAGNNGCAVAAVPHANDVFAVALETNDDTGVKLVEAVIL
jgi:hypothetical protein